MLNGAAMTNQAKAPTSSADAPLIQFDYARIEKAHDVRKLVVCKCGGLASQGMAIDLDGEWYHGRCFIHVFGFKSLLALPRSKQDRLTLGDLGPDVMRRLIEARS
jgi:hypothetical protein